MPKRCFTMKSKLCFPYIHEALHHFSTLILVFSALLFWHSELACFEIWKNLSEATSVYSCTSSTIPSLCINISLQCCLMGCFRELFIDGKAMVPYMQLSTNCVLDNFITVQILFTLYQKLILQLVDNYTYGTIAFSCIKSSWLFNHKDNFALHSYAV